MYIKDIENNQIIATIFKIKIVFKSGEPKYVDIAFLEYIYVHFTRQKLIILSNDGRRKF